MSMKTLIKPKFDADLYIKTNIQQNFFENIIANKILLLDRKNIET